MFHHVHRVPTSLSWSILSFNVDNHPDRCRDSSGRMKISVQRIVLFMSLSLQVLPVKCAEIKPGFSDVNSQGDRRRHSLYSIDIELPSIYPAVVTMPRPPQLMHCVPKTFLLCCASFP